MGNPFFFVTLFSTHSHVSSSVLLVSPPARGHGLRVPDLHPLGPGLLPVVGGGCPRRQLSAEGGQRAVGREGGGWVSHFGGDLCSTPTELFPLPGVLGGTSCRERQTAPKCLAGNVSLVAGGRPQSFWDRIFVLVSGFRYGSPRWSGLPHGAVGSSKRVRQKLIATSS